LPGGKHLLTRNSEESIKLTMGAVIVNPKYAKLFTDEEVNACYELLCEKGYY